MRVTRRPPVENVRSSSRRIAVSIAILVALGTGANLAVLSVIGNVFEGSRPYREVEALIVLENRGAYDLGVRKVEAGEMSWPDFKDAAARQHSLVALEGILRPERTVCDTGGRTRSAWRVTVTRGLMPLLGIRAALGRTLAVHDFEPGSPRVAVITDRLWRRQFFADPGAVGRVVRTDGLAFAVVGVVSDDAIGFLRQRKEFLGATDQDECLVVPLVPGGEGRRERLLALNLENRALPALTVLGRLRPGTVLATAAREFREISKELAARNPETNAGRTVEAIRLREWRTRAFAHMRPMLLLVSILALIVACASAAGLIASDAIRRQPEMSLRHALGASRPRLARLVMRRAIGWTLPGGLIGLAMAWTVLRWLSSLSTSGNAVLRVSFNANLLLTLLCLTIGTGVTIGGVATWLFSRQDLTLGLKEAGLTMSLGRRRRRVLTAMVTLQVAAATALGLVSGLLLHSMTNVLAVDLGFDPAQSFSIRFLLPEDDYPTSQEQFAYLETALARVRAHPEVASAAIAQSPPLSRTVVTLGGDLYLEAPGRVPENLTPIVAQYVTSGYFESLGMPVTLGRSFSDDDYRAKLPAVIVEDAFCRTKLAAMNPLDAGVRIDGAFHQIVGVVHDVRPSGPTATAWPTLYILRRSGQPASFGYVVVRPTGNSRAVAAEVLRELVRIDPKVVVDDPESLRDLLFQTLDQRRRTLHLLLLTAGVVFLLTGFSVSGVLSQFVEHRAKEIGLRKALGASSARTIWLVVHSIVGPGSFGLLLGCLGGWFLAQRLSTELFGLNAADPLTIGISLTVEILFGLAAAAGPAGRATRIEPVTVLRGS